MRPYRFRAFALSFLVFLASSLLISNESGLNADIIKLKTGVTYEGKIINRRGSYIQLELRNGTKRTFSSSEIETTEEKPCSWDVFDEQKAKLDKTNAAVWIELSGFCAENALWDEWRESLKTAIEIEPDNEIARRLLDFERKGGAWAEKDLSDGSWSSEDFLRNGYVWNKKKKKWLSPDEAKRAAGLELFRGEWKTKKEIKDILIAEETAAVREMISTSYDDLIAAGNSAETGVEKERYYYKLAIRKAPKNHKGYCYLAISYLLFSGDTRTADRILDYADKVCRTAWMLVAVRGELEVYKCNFGRAEKLLRKAQKLAVAESFNYDSDNIYLGIALYYQRRLEEAVEALLDVKNESVAGLIVGDKRNECLCSALRLLGRKEEADKQIEEYKNLYAIVNDVYQVRLSAITKAKADVMADIVKYLKESPTAEMRNVHRKWLTFDPAFSKYWKEPDFLKIVSTEGADSEDWSATGIDIEDISAKDIRKAAKKKSRGIDTTSISGKWGVINTGHYYLFSNALRPDVVEIGNRLELFASVLDELFGTKVKKGSEPILRIFRSKEQYIKYITPYYRVPEKAAYYILASEEVVTCAPVLSQLEAKMGDIFNACTEQRLYADFGRPLPTWLTFGLSAYFSTARHNTETFSFETGAAHSEYLKVFKNQHPAEKPVPELAYFFTQTRIGLKRVGIEERAGKADLWGFIYFLMESPDEYVKKTLSHYFEALRKMKGQKEALEVFFADIDRKTLSQMFVEFINAQ